MLGHTQMAVKETTNLRPILWFDVVFFVSLILLFDDEHLFGLISIVEIVEYEWILLLFLLLLTF